MRKILIGVLSLTFSITSGFAHQISVRMYFSGNGAPSPANLQQPNSSTGEENVTGSGTLGSFTLRNITATESTPSPSSTCWGANKAFFARIAGGGVFRFDDGSLLKVSLVQGGDCVDFSANGGAGEGHCTIILQIKGGTGRFKNASGTLTYTETADPVLSDAANLPIFFTEIGEITGSIAGVGSEEHHGEQ